MARPSSTSRTASTDSSLPKDASRLFTIADPVLFYPASRAMRADPRFLPLMRETGIYQYWLDTRTQPDMCETPEERAFEVCLALRKDQGK